MLTVCGVPCYSAVDWVGGGGGGGYLCNGFGSERSLRYSGA